MGKFLCFCMMAMVVAVTFTAFGEPGPRQTARIASIGVVAEARGIVEQASHVSDTGPVAASAPDQRKPLRRQQVAASDCAQWSCLPSTMDLSAILITPRPGTDGRS